MIDVICIRAEGDREASDISDSLIPSDFIAIQRGTNFLNEEWYKRKRRTIRVPYKDSINIKAIASVYESKLNIVGNHIITSHSIEISRNGIWSTIDIEQHGEPSS